MIQWSSQEVIVSARQFARQERWLGSNADSFILMALAEKIGKKIAEAAG